MYLCIDTSTRFGAIGLWSPQERLFVRALAWRSRHNHTAELMPAVHELLNGAHTTSAGLRGVAVTLGPGGFSALRAGLGAAKGLAFALSIPVVGASTLEATAYPYREAGWPVCPIIEAGRDLAGWARFQAAPDGWRQQTPDRVTPVAQLLERAGRHTLFCGEGATSYAERLREAMGARAHFVAEPLALGRLQGLGELASARLDAGDSDSAAGLQPSYLRPPGITKANPPQRIRYGTDGPAGQPAIS